MDNFKNRQEMINWFYSLPKDEALNYFQLKIKERNDSKNLQFSPCQVELRSLKNIPSILSYRKITGLDNYYKWSSELFCLKQRFEDIYNVSFNNSLNYEIQIDTREQLPLWDTNNIINKKLDYGDYKIFSDCRFVLFERKSIADFIATMSSGYDRFCRELLRAQENNENLITIVEGKLEDVMNFKNHHAPYSVTKVTPEYIFHNVRDIIQKFKNNQFLFVSGRDNMKQVMINIFLMNKYYNKVDLQLLYDLKKI